MQTVKSIWDFFQTELLGMSWLNRLIGDLLNACGLDTAGKVGGSVQFFIYDTIKIMVLLGVVILIISYIQSYFPPERTKKILGRFHGVGANCIAALLGTVTPFCSCSSIPLFIGFTSAGLPLGVTFSFLISSPMVDFGSLVLLMSIFGWKVAVLYVVLGLLDNLKVHHSNKVSAWAKEHEAQIRLFHLPPYCPEYNPDEYLNNDLKRNLGTQAMVKTVQELEENATEVLNQFSADTEHVKSNFDHPKLKPYKLD